MNESEKLLVMTLDQLGCLPKEKQIEIALEYLMDSNSEAESIGKKYGISARTVQEYATRHQDAIGSYLKSKRKDFFITIISLIKFLVLIKFITFNRLIILSVIFNPTLKQVVHITNFV